MCILENIYFNTHSFDDIQFGPEAQIKAGWKSAKSLKRGLLSSNSFLFHSVTSLAEAKNKFGCSFL